MWPNIFPMNRFHIYKNKNKKIQSSHTYFYGAYSNCSTKIYHEPKNSFFKIFLCRVILGYSNFNFNFNNHERYIKKKKIQSMFQVLTFF